MAGDTFGSQLVTIPSGHGPGSRRVADLSLCGPPRALNTGSISMLQHSGIRISIHMLSALTDPCRGETIFSPIRKMRFAGDSWIS
jgi:hypothetical protein